MAALVLKKFDVRRPSDGSSDSVHVVGRQAGLGAFLMTLLRVDPTTEIRVNRDRVQVVQGSFFGQNSMTIPNSQVTGVVGGYRKPKEAFFAAIASVVMGLFIAAEASSFTPALVGLAFGVGFGVAYALKKDMSLFVQNGGDTAWGLTFKRSVIENVAIDSQRVNQAVQVINRIVLTANGAEPAAPPAAPKREPVTA